MEPAGLDRFLDAQRETYAAALAEIRSGRKRSHWMWFIFPQLQGLGSSPTAQFYAIRDRAEAEAYLRHAELGPRLLDCANALLGLEAHSASDVFGYPDDLKLKSCATLFAEVSPPGSVFEQILRKYFDGERDLRTLELLSIQR